MSTPTITYHHAFCGRCGLPYPASFFSGSETCTQGTLCAANFSKNGLLGYAHFGSWFDTSTFAVAPDHADTFASLDPVCDACLSQALLLGRIVDISEPGGLHAHPQHLIGNTREALAWRRELLGQNLTEEILHFNLEP
jgi:hypothetical protein